MAIDNKQATSNEELLNMAIRTAKDGNPDGAKVMLRQVYSRNKNNETAILWLAKLAKSEKERREWLEILLEVNPDNQTAKKALKKMNDKQAASDNRTLLIFGAVAVMMFVIVLVILLLVLL